MRPLHKKEKINPPENTNNLQEIFVLSADYCWSFMTGKKLSSL